MRVNELIRNSVFFLGTETGNKEFVPYGTAFNVGLVEGELMLKYIVTAKHVISDIQRANRSVKARLHLKSGGSVIRDMSHLSWISHPTWEKCDVVVAPSDLLPTDYDYSVCRLNPGILTAEYIAKYDVGCGDEVFTVGLLARHFGKSRNIPVARIGNIAAMPEEMVDLESGGQHLAYLIESRSIGGLSGSPVYLNTPPVRLVGTSHVSTAGHESEYLMGVNIGLFEVGSDGDRIPTEPPSPRREFLETMSAGIAVVIPVDRIMEILQAPELVADRVRSIDTFYADNPDHRRPK